MSALEWPDLHLLEQVVRHSSDAVAILDAREQVLLLNPSMKSLLAECVSTTGNHKPCDCLDELSTQLGLDGRDWASIRTWAAQPPTAELTLSLPGRGSRHVRVHAAAIEQPGKAALRCLTVVDITPIKQAQAQRDQALRFLSHDLRTPVVSILALTDQLGRAVQTDLAQRQVVSRITDHAQQLMRWMDGFSIESRAHSETLQLSERLVDDLIEEAVAQAQDLASQRNMRVVVQGQDAYFFVQVATGLMVRAVLNVLLDAIAQGEPGTDIGLRTQLSASAAEPVVEIQVSHQVAQLPDSMDMTVTEGFGLSLDLAQTVLRRHGGNLRQEPLSQVGPTPVAQVVLALPCVVDTES